MDDPTFQVRLDVAEVKGMLSQVISNHDTRIVNLETKTDNHDTRINEKGNQLARHDERIHDLEGDMKEAKDDTKSREAKNISIFSIAIAGIVAVIALVNFINTGAIRP
jgi:chromosome segregation ATPase